MIHVLAPLRVVDDGYLGSCSCGWERTHPHRSGVEAQHEFHVRIIDLRASLNEGKASND